MKVFSVAVLGLALVTYGCAGTQTKGDRAVTKDTEVHCPHCGAGYTVEEGLKESP